MRGQRYAPSSIVCKLPDPVCAEAANVATTISPSTWLAILRNPDARSTSRVNDSQFLKNHHLYFRREIFWDQVRSVLTLKDRMGRRVEPIGFG